MLISKTREWSVVVRRADPANLACTGEHAKQRLRSFGPQSREWGHLASYQNRLSGHTACDYHIQPHATCTMASLHGTLPYIYLDPPLTTMSIVFMFNIYHIQDGEPYNWSSLLDKAIEQQDLRPLFTSIALLVDKHTLLPYPVNYTRWKRGNSVVELVLSSNWFSPVLTPRLVPTLTITTGFCWKVANQTIHWNGPIYTYVDDLSILASIPSLIWQMRTVELGEPRDSEQFETYVWFYVILNRIGWSWRTCKTETEALPVGIDPMCILRAYVNLYREKNCSVLHTKMRLHIIIYTNFCTDQIPLCMCVAGG
jgi:hypothetical protein